MSVHKDELNGDVRDGMNGNLADSRFPINAAPFEGAAAFGLIWKVYLPIRDY